MKKILIDTNIYSCAMRADQKVINFLRKVDKIGISVISIGELYSGFKGGTREQKNREELDFFLDSPRVILYAVDVETSDYYSKIITNLKQSGKPIPTNAGNPQPMCPTPISCFF